MQRLLRRLVFSGAMIAAGPVVAFSRYLRPAAYGAGRRNSPYITHREHDTLSGARATVINAPSHMRLSLSQPSPSLPPARYCSAQLIPYKMFSHI